MTTTTGRYVTNADVIAHRVNRAGRVRAFVQPCGTLRIVTRSCAEARVEIGRAVRSLGWKEATAGIAVFQVRFAGTDKVLAYPMIHDPRRSDVDPRTGAFLAVPAR